MNTVHRGLEAVISGMVLLTLLACIQGCEATDDEFVGTMNRQWATKGFDGEVERVVFDGEEITFGLDTENEYKCPYRVSSFSEKRRTINIMLTCKKRTGAVAPVAYRMQFRDDGAAFTFFLEDRNVGEYRATTSR